MSGVSLVCFDFLKIDNLMLQTGLFTSSMIRDPFNQAWNQSFATLRMTNERPSQFWQQL